MRAIILVGGEGTRLRPLTLRTPKQLVPVLNRPLLDHLLLHLKAHDITSITLALTRRNEAVRAAFGDGSRLGVAIDYAYEDTPLGSGGAIASVAAGWGETFLVCNGDIVTDLDVTAFIEAHRARQAELSLALYEVDDPSAFGVVVLDADARVTRFVEKPPREEAPSHLINAGFWLFEPLLLAEMDATQFNRVEDALFPTLADAGRAISGYRHDGYWIDVGNPEAYRRVNLDLLRGACRGIAVPESSDARISGAASVVPPVLVGAGTVIEAGAILGGPVLTGDRCVIATGAQVSGSVLWDDVSVAEGAVVVDSVLASGVRVGAGASVRGATLGHGAVIPPGTAVAPGTRVGPDEVYATPSTVTER